MTTSSNPWPCPNCKVKNPSFCRTIAPNEQAADRLRSGKVRQTNHTAVAGRLVFQPGKSSDDVHVLCDGWAFTFHRLPDGRRQIFSFLLPGDVFSSRMMFGIEDYQSVASLTEIRFSRINSAELQSEIRGSSDLCRNAAAVCARERRLYLEAAVNLGQRGAEERIADFIMRLIERLDPMEGGGNRGRYPFPIRQAEIADAMGLTPVHVSRVMMKFRKEQLIDVLWGELVIKDRVELNRRASGG